MHKARLLKLADYLESLPRNYKHFDMHTWLTVGDSRMGVSQYKDKKTEEYIVRVKESAPNCGTVACAVGHIPNAFPRSGFKLSLGEYKHERGAFPVYQDFQGEDAVAQFFGIQRSDVDYLFMPDSYRSNRIFDSKPVSKGEVIKRIRRFVETDGKISYR